jgi:hypothetical protein
MGHLHRLTRRTQSVTQRFRMIGFGWLQHRPWKFALAWLALLAPLFYASYGLANYMATQAFARGDVAVVAFDWERHIPFWQWTVFPYWSINFFYGLSLFLARTRHELNRHGLRLLTAQIVAVSCFVIWPLHFSFGLPDADGLAGMLFAALRGFDKPFNQAPSLHIALAVILWDFYRQQITLPIARWFLHVWALLICASVLTTFQHHFIDIPTGALLGVICVWLWPLERAVSMRQAWRIASTTQQWKLATSYAIGATLFIAAAWYWRSLTLWLLWPAASLLLVAMFYAGFGARGFQTNGRGQMRWSSRWLLGPYRLAAWINSRLWTRKLPIADEVLPGLWLGRLPSDAEWKNAGKPTIVSLCAELQNADFSRGACVPILDLTRPSRHSLQRAALIVNAHRRAGHTVWVCCALGFSRSARAMMRSLVLAGDATDAAHALQRIQQVRPQVVVKDH